MHRWIWKGWHGFVIGLGMVLVVICAALLLPTLALIQYEARENWT
jgi:hypothetical protein